MEHVHKDKVMVYDTDYQGIAHYASYYRFVTNALSDFREARLNKLLSDSNLWFVIVESHAKYMKPLKAGDSITVKIKPELLGEKAVKFAFAIYKGKTLTTEGYLVQVAIDPIKWAVVPIPEKLKKALR